MTRQNRVCWKTWRRIMALELPIPASLDGVVRLSAAPFTAAHRTNVQFLTFEYAHILECSVGTGKAVTVCCLKAILRRSTSWKRSSESAWSVCAAVFDVSRLCVLHCMFAGAFQRSTVMCSWLQTNRGMHTPGSQSHCALSCSSQRIKHNGFEPLVHPNRHIPTDFLSPFFFFFLEK